MHYSATYSSLWSANHTFSKWLHCCLETIACQKLSAFSPSSRSCSWFSASCCRIEVAGVTRGVPAVGSITTHQNWFSIGPEVMHQSNAASNAVSVFAFWSWSSTNLGSSIIHSVDRQYLVPPSSRGPTCVAIKSFIEDSLSSSVNNSLFYF